MKTDKKRLLKIVAASIFYVIAAAMIIFIYQIFSHLNGTAKHTMEAVTVGIVAFTLWLIFWTVGVRGKTKRYVNALIIFILAGCVGWAGWGYYLESIPTVSDRDLLLHEYEPFKEDTKTVSLEEEATLQFTEDQRIRIDGATALYPVYAGFVQAVYPEGEYEIYAGWEEGGDVEGYGMVTCSNTVHAYDRLLEGRADVIFVAGPSKAQREKAAEMGMEFHLTPVGREAFVFFVNSKNPVEGLTVDEIQKIYSGQLTNWKEVGGPGWSIRPFQRAENSGSQTALQNLMGDIPIIEPETEERVDAMSGIIEMVANYKNYKNAIGFSFRYYSTEMVSSNEIRLLALNGVLPTKETIADGSYPIASEFYAVTASKIGEPAPEVVDDNLAAFLNWVLSEQGQEIVEKTGYVPLQK